MSHRIGAIAAATLCLLALAGVARGASGDVTASLVADIFPGTDGSSPGIFTNVNGTLYFNADDGANGRELWKSDGTQAGTVMVEDAIPGGGINPAGDSSPFFITNVGGTAYFSAEDVTNGRELWKSDGSPAGTKMVEVFGGGINPGAGSSDPTELENVNGIVFFQASDGTHGRELWKSDGTPAGTVMVEDAIPGGGINPAGDSSPNRLTNVNGTLYFTADDGTNGTELWKSDGSPAGTVMVDDDAPADGGINPADNANPRELTNVGGTVFFQADDGSGRELWKSDGTPAGTVMVEDAIPGGGINPAGESVPTDLANVGGALLFRADDGTNGPELWRTDGTAAGTAMIDDDDPPDGGIAPAGDGSFPADITDVGGTAFFRADDGTNGIELWRTDGTAAGTAMIDDDDPPDGGINPVGGASPGDVVNVNGTVYFDVDDGTNGREVWRTDGTAAGTAIVEDAVPGGGVNPTFGSDPSGLTNVNGTLFFRADDGTSGAELWRTVVELQDAEGVEGGGASADPSLPSNQFSVGGLSGRKLTITVNAAGSVTVDDAGSQASAASAVAAAQNLLKPSSASGGPGEIAIALKLTKKAKRKLRKKGKVKISAQITFAPTGGAATSQAAKLTIKK